MVTCEYCKARIRESDAIFPRIINGKYVYFCNGKHLANWDAERLKVVATAAGKVS